MTTDRVEQPCSLLRATQQLLRADGRTIIQLHTDTGIPFYWLRTFSAGTMKSPNINRVQELYEALTSTRLTVYFTKEFAQGAQCNS